MMSNKPELLSDANMRRLMVLQPVYSDDVDYAHMIRMGRAVEAATRAEADMWRDRFEWLAAQHWVETEAAFRLDLADAGGDGAEYMAQLIATIDARLKTPNVALSGGTLGDDEASLPQGRPLECGVGRLVTKRKEVRT